MKIRIPTRTVSILIVAFAMLTLLFGFGYINSLVSYKYEVQEAQLSAKSSSGLNTHDFSILWNIVFYKYAAMVSGVLLVLGLITHECEPSFNGRVSYKSKAQI